MYMYIILYCILDISDTILVHVHMIWLETEYIRHRPLDFRTSAWTHFAARLSFRTASQVAVFQVKFIKDNSVH